MRSTRSPLAAMAAALLTCLLLAAPAGAKPPPDKDIYGPDVPYCGTFKLDKLNMWVWAEHTSCKNATRVIKKWWKGKEGKDYKSYNGGSGYAGYVLLKGAYKGWKCTSGSGGGGGGKGKKNAYYQNGY
jgi:hypothetical protein